VLLGCCYKYPTSVEYYSSFLLCTSYLQLSILNSVINYTNYNLNNNFNYHLQILIKLQKFHKLQALHNTIDALILRCKQWVQATRRDDLHTKSFEYVSANYLLCAGHFECSQFMNATTRSNLVWNATLTVFNIQNAPHLLESKRQPPAERCTPNNFITRKLEIKTPGLVKQTYKDRVFRDRNMVYAGSIYTLYVTN
jgi:hypothetical protein